MKIYKQDSKEEVSIEEIIEGIAFVAQCVVALSLIILLGSYALATLAAFLLG